MIERARRACNRRALTRACADAFFLAADHVPIAALALRLGLSDDRLQPARRSDAPGVLAAARGHGGAAGEAAMAAWFRSHQSAFQVAHGPAGDVEGFLLVVEVDGPVAWSPPEDARLMEQITGWMTRRGLPRPGRVALLANAWVSADGSQRPSALALEALVFLFSVAIWEPDRFDALIVLAGEGGRWLVDNAIYVSDALKLDHAPPLYAVAWDFRSLPADEMMEVMVSGVSAPWLTASLSGVGDRGLDRAAFGEAVRDALRHLHDPAALLNNPLLHHPLVSARVSSGAAGGERVAALRALLRAGAEPLRAEPRTQKLYRALLRGYLDPAPTQEIAAERLGVPYSSFRRHLRQGVERVAASLWAHQQGVPLEQ